MIARYSQELIDKIPLSERHGLTTVGWYYLNYDQIWHCGPFDSQEETKIFQEKHPAPTEEAP